MKITRAAVPFAAALMILLAGRPVFADRPPTPDERARIEAALRSLGFESWEEIEFDDGHWEVDDARRPDGKEFDLKLEADTLRVLEQEED
jgi:hypothetical protein